MTSWIKRIIFDHLASEKCILYIIHPNAALAHALVAMDLDQIFALTNLLTNPGNKTAFGLFRWHLSHLIVSYSKENASALTSS